MLVAGGTIYHVREFVGHDHSHESVGTGGRDIGVIQHVLSPVGYQAPVLHCACAKVRDGDLV